MKHMTLEEWDRTVAPYLAMIERRAVNIQRDADAILEWVKMLPCAPNFETRAHDDLTKSLASVILAGENISIAIKQYSQKEKVE